MESFPVKLLCYSELTRQFVESFEANQDAPVSYWLDGLNAAKFSEPRAAAGSILQPADLRLLFGDLQLRLRLSPTCHPEGRSSFLAA
jgi:hypothetical protein